MKLFKKFQISRRNMVSLLTLLIFVIVIFLFQSFSIPKKRIQAQEFAGGDPIFASSLMKKSYSTLGEAEPSLISANYWQEVALSQREASNTELIYEEEEEEESLIEEEVSETFLVQEEEIVEDTAEEIVYQQELVEEEVVEEEIIETPHSSGSYLGTFDSTAYAIGDGMTPSTMTANGTDVSNTIYTPDGYRIIAVDTSVIPMNSIVEVHVPGMAPFLAKASDTGSAINGYKIDLLVDSVSGAYNYGYQTGIEIYLIN